MLDLNKCAQRCDRALAELLEDGYCTATSFERSGGREWRQIAVESMWRMLESGLMVSQDVGRYLEDGSIEVMVLADLVDPQVEGYADASNWAAMTFGPTPSGDRLAEEFNLIDCEETPPGFEERLWEIFTQHGVGPDVPCPYQVPLDWKRREFEQVDGVWRLKS